MPPGIEQAYYFQIFNTISWQIMQGSPMLLFLKFLGATNTILGLAAALNPLMNILQIPAASHVERIGYKPFVLRGWALRTVFVGVMTMAPLLSFILDRTTCMVLAFFALFMYSTLRGISLCGFLPWITHLVPEKIRGTYISRDQMFSSLAALITTVGCAALFYPHESQLAFAVAFGLSLAGGILSLYFLQRMPDVPITPSQANKDEVPWKQMLYFPPFFKIMIYNVVINSALAASGVFWISILRENFQWDSSHILLMSGITTFFSIGAFWFFGLLIDRTGSLPMLRFGGWILVIHYSIWWSIAIRLLPLNLYTSILLGLTAGTGVSLFNMANTRLVMATVPEMGRSHFFALYSVINSLTLGFLPIIWGIILDALGGFHLDIQHLTLHLHFDKYGIFYLFLIFTIIAGQFVLPSLKESRAMSNEEFFRELLVDTPSRAITRLLNRRPFIQ